MKVSLPCVTGFQNRLDTILSTDISIGRQALIADPSSGLDSVVNESCFNVIQSCVAGNLGVNGKLADPFASRSVTVSFVSIAVWLFASALPMAGQESQTRRATALQLLSEYTERVRWQHYWLPATVSTSYVPGTEVQVQVLFARTAAGFCASALEICQIYERDGNGSFELLTEWGAEANRSEASLPTRFAEEYAKARGLRPIQGAGPGQRQKDQLAFDATKMVAPVRSQQRSETFDSPSSLTWKLQRLMPPKPISMKTPPLDASILRGEILTVVKSFRKGCGAAGQAMIPFYGSQDPRVFIYVDLGGHCEKGVFEFLKRAEGGWSFSRFVVDEGDVKLLLPRIQKARMETLRLTS